MSIRPGTILQGPKWPEPGEVNLAEEQDGYVHIIGVEVNSRRHVDQLVKLSDLPPEITAAPAPFGAAPPSVFLSLEAKRYRLPPSAKHQQLAFDFIVPKGRVSSLMGVLNYLQSKYENMYINLRVEKGQLTHQEFEDKVRGAFRQMGIDV